MRTTLSLIILFVAGGNARAHFELQAPACWMSQDSFGLPQKLGPCGDEEQQRIHARTISGPRPSCQRQYGRAAGHL